MRRGCLVLLFGLIVVIALAATAVLVINPRLTQYVESEEFRLELDKQTSKGLHLQGHYGAIRRTGFLTATAEGFTGENGEKAIKSMETGKVDAQFNPLGVFLRRWQLDHIRIESGKAEIQIYEPRPESKPPKPWYAILLPDRVYLERVICHPADVTWRLRGRQAGFFKTRLLITPYGRDFEYRATGGTLKTGMLPELALRQLHLVITKELLTVHDLELAPDPESEGRIHARGRAGLKNDKSVSGKLRFSRVPVAPWIPEDWASTIRGLASGEVLWQGEDMTLESSSGHGSFRIDGARVGGTPFLDQASVVTGKKSIEDLKLKRCSFEFEWKYPRVEVKNIDIEAAGAFSIKGTVAIENQNLRGTLRFGATRKYLEWLPVNQQIFVQQENGYRWTSVKLTGTLQEPRDDLSPRIEELLKKSPGSAIGIFFRHIGEWFQKNAGEK
jgi:hypothetical protein